MSAAGISPVAMASEHVDEYFGATLQTFSWLGPVSTSRDKRECIHRIFMQDERTSGRLVSEAVVTWAQFGDVTYTGGRGLRASSDWESRLRLVRAFLRDVAAHDLGDKLTYGVVSVGSYARGENGLAALIALSDAMREEFAERGSAFCYAIHPAEMAGNRIDDMHMHIAWFGDAEPELGFIRDAVRAMASGF